MYEAIIAPIMNVREHPNADKLKLATVCGFQVVVDKSQQEGTIGVFFPCDGKLTHPMLMANNLYHKHPETLEPMGGFFGVNGRVRAQRFRQEKSEGIWLPLESLAWTGADLTKLKKGYTFTSINNHLICKKYVSVSTQRKMNSNQKQKTSKFPTFKRHYETPKLRYKLNEISVGDIVSITEKAHGTSGRTARVIKAIKPRFWHKLFPPRRTYKYVSGSRNLLLKFDEGTHCLTSRQKIHEHFKDMGIHKGETFYYEIVGYDNGIPIMGEQPIEDQKLRKKYGDTMIYSYGCDEAHQFDFYVYRITMVNEDGDVVEYSDSQLKKRCKDLGIKVVPELMKPFVCEDVDGLMDTCESLTLGSSVLDDTHIKEGVVLKNHTTDKVYKYKSYHFCELEGIQKNNDEYVDVEEIS